MKKFKNILKSLDLKANFKSITWPKKERVKKELLIVAIGTLVFGVFTFGIDNLAQLVLNLIY